MNKLLLLPILFSVPCLSVSDDFIRNKDDLRRKYSYLYQQQVTEPTPGERHFHNARHWQRQGIHILSLKGDAFEMAFQHGKLLASSVKVGAIAGSASMVERAISNTFAHRPAFASLAKRVIDKKYSTAMLRNAVKNYPDLTQSVLERAFAISESAGVNMRTVLDAAVGPSVMMMLANSHDPDLARFAPSQQCTSFYAWGPYTPDGNLLIARNTDYPLVGYFEDNATVAYLQPTDGGQKVMAITTAGVHSAAVTGINEAGIFIGTHSLPSSATGPTGTPMIMWMHDALAKGKTLNEVIANLTQYPAEVGWTYVVASGAENRVVSVEVDNKGFGLRETKDGKHVQTNHYLTKELSPRMQHFNEGTRDETENRFIRTDNMMEASKGIIDEQIAVRILGDHWDRSSGQQNGFPSNIGATTNVSSLVYSPAKKKVWLATGTSPAANNNYLQLPLPADFDSATFAQLPEKLLVNDWFQQQHPNRYQALKLYVDAMKAFEQKLDMDKAHQLTVQAANLAPEVGHYRLMQGMMEIRRGKFSDALATLRQALEKVSGGHGKALTHYYMGRVYADQGKKAEALASLRQAIQASAATSGIIPAAENVIKKLASKASYQLNWHEVIPQYQFGDSQSY